VKKTLLCLLCSAVAFLTAVPLFAGSIHPNPANEVIFGSSPSDSFAFDGTGSGNFNLTLNNVMGSADGIGLFESLQSGGQKWGYSVSNGVVMSTGNCGFGCMTLSNTEFTFTLTCTNTTHDCSKGTVLLTGMLTLVDIQNTATKTGTTNNDMVVNLAVTGGTLAGYFDGQGILQFTLGLSSNIFNAAGQSIITKGELIKGQATTGSLQSPLLSEPSTLSLLGFGLLGMGGMVKRTISSALRS
jgi:hypothetical protein